MFFKEKEKKNINVVREEKKILDEYTVLYHEASISLHSQFSLTTSNGRKEKRKEETKAKGKIKEQRVFLRQFVFLSTPDLFFFSFFLEEKKKIFANFSFFKLP